MAKVEEALLILGDEKSLLEVILPEPEGKWRTADGAFSLADYSTQSGRERIYEKVLPFLESEDIELRRFAMAFFSRVEYPPTRPHMEKALQSGWADFRLYAFKSLLDARADRGETSRLVNAMLDDKDKEVLGEALAEAGPYNDLIPLNQICKHLKHEDGRVREMAVYALIDCTNPRTLEPLLGATRDEEIAVRAQAALALGTMGRPAAYARLIEMLTDPDAEVRELTIYGLMVFEDSKAIPEIRKLEKSDPDECVRKTTEYAVRDLSRR